MNYKELAELRDGRRRSSGRLKPLPYDPMAKVNRPVEVLAPTTGSVGEMMTRAMPLSGEAWAAHDVKNDLQKGEYGSAALNTLLGLLPFGGTIAGMRQVGKSFPMKLSGGDVLTRSKGSLPDSVNMQGFHWSPEADLTMTDPNKYGRGIKGAEAGRLEGQRDIRPRSFFYDNDQMRESGLGGNQYRATLKDVYPADDPRGFRRLAAEKFPQEEGLAGNELERLIKGAGYKGYENRNMVSYFDPVGVAPHVQGTVIPAPKTPGYGITDTTEVLAGSRTGHMEQPGPMPEAYGEAFDAYQRRMMDTLKAQNSKLYGAVDPAGEGAVKRGYYTNHRGEVERNPVYAHTMPYSEEAERTVGAVSPLSALLYGQNAYGYSGVAPSKLAGKGSGLRTSISGATPDQEGEAIRLLGDRGLLAVPNELGLTVGGFGQTGDKRLLKEATKAFNEAGIPQAEALQGGFRSGYGELPWGAEGSGQATEAALEPILKLPDPELLRLDRTGQFQQTGRLLNAADSALAERFGVQPRQDLTTLRDIVRAGGLSGLLNRVKTEGYKGLPAVAGGGIALDEDEDRRLSW